MSLKARASWRTSPGPRTATRAEKSPSSTRPAASTRSSSGAANDRMPRDHRPRPAGPRGATPPTATIRAIGDAGDQPDRRPDRPDAERPDATASRPPTNRPHPIRRRSRGATSRCPSAPAAHGGPDQLRRAALPRRDALAAPGPCHGSSAAPPIAPAAPRARAHDRRGGQGSPSGHHGGGAWPSAGRRAHAGSAKR